MSNEVETITIALLKEILEEVRETKKATKRNEPERTYHREAWL